MSLEFIFKHVEEGTTNARPGQADRAQLEEVQRERAEFERIARDSQKQADERRRDRRQEADREEPAHRQPRSGRAEEAQRQILRPTVAQPRREPERADDKRSKPSEPERPKQPRSGKADEQQRKAVSDLRSSGGDLAKQVPVLGTLALFVSRNTAAMALLRLSIDSLRRFFTRQLVRAEVVQRRAQVFGERIFGGQFPPRRAAPIDVPFRALPDPGRMPIRQPGPIGRPQLAIESRAFNRPHTGVATMAPPVVRAPIVRQPVVAGPPAVRAGAAGAGVAARGGAAAGAAGISMGAIVGVGLAVVAVTAAAVMAIKALTSKASELSQRLAPFSGQLSLARARQEVARIQEDIRSARRLGGDLARFTDLETRFDRILSRFGAALQQSFLPVINTVGEAIASPIEDILDIQKSEAGELSPEQDILGIFNRRQAPAVSWNGLEFNAGQQTMQPAGTVNTAKPLPKLRFQE